VVLAQFVAGGGWLVLGAVCAMRAADAISEVYFGLWQRSERMRVIGVGRAIQSAFSVAFVSVACGLGAASAGAALAGALGSAILLAFMHWSTVRDGELRRVAASGGLSWPRMGRLVLLGLPLGTIVLLGALQANVPRYFIEHGAGHAALGLFAAASQLTTSGNVIVGALGAAALPRLAAAHGAGGADFRGLTNRLCLAGAGMGVAGVALSALLGRRLLVLLYRPEFGEADGVLLVLSVAAGLGFVASFLGYVLTASRVIIIQPLLLLVTLGVMVALCALLVPQSGAVGAAWAMVGGSAVQVVGSWLALRRSHARQVGA
jgi:O-antigen/teichoic acid export membrane protein